MTARVGRSCKDVPDEEMILAADLHLIADIRWIVTGPGEGQSLISAPLAILNQLFVVDHQFLLPHDLSDGRITKYCPESLSPLSPPCVVLIVSNSLALSQH